MRGAAANRAKDERTEIKIQRIVRQVFSVETTLSFDAPEITNLTEAINLFTREIGGRIIRLEQGALGPMCAVLGDGHGNKVYLFFKRDWLHSYGHFFPDEDWKGFGQTLNLKVLEKAAYDAAWIIVVLPSGAIYKCWAPDWLEYARKHKTIRTPSTEIGLEASIPTKMLERISS